MGMKIQRGALVVKAEDGTEKTILIDLDTVMPTGVLAVGKRVSVHFDSLDSGRARAVDVRLLDSVAAPAQQATREQH